MYIIILLIFLCIIIIMLINVHVHVHNYSYSTIKLFICLQIDYPKDSDMMEVFECQKTQTNKYDDFNDTVIVRILRMIQFNVIRIL